MRSFLRKRKESSSTVDDSAAGKETILSERLPVSIPLPILIVSSIILIPYLLSLIHLSPFSILLSIPLILLVWVLSIPISLLSAAYLADSKYPPTVPSSSHLNPIYLPSRSFSQLHSKSFRTPIHATSPSVSQAADLLIALILRDFIQKWHIPLIYGAAATSASDSSGASSPQPHELFSLATERSIRFALTAGIERAARLDLPTLGIGQILPAVTNHLEKFRIAELALDPSAEPEDIVTGSLEGKKAGHGASNGGRGRKAALSTSGSSEEVDLFLAAKYQSLSKLHPAVSNVSSPDSKPSELEHLRSLTTRALKYVLPPDERESRAVFTTVREVVACTILMPVIDMLSDPDFWNGILDQKTGAAMQEQKLVQQLRQALDRQSSSDSSNLAKSSSPTTIRSLTSFTLSSSSPSSSQSKSHPKHSKTQHSFSTFLKSIEEADSILEARRSRNDVSMQIRKTKSALAGVSSTDPGASERRNGLMRYLEKLHSALGVAEKKVEELSTGHRQVANSYGVTLPTSPPRSSSFSSQITLEQVLHNATTLSYWMEHMDRQKRSEVIQFWLAVESFKDPLESVESESEDTGSSSFGAMLPDSSTIATLKEDLRLFTEVYYPSSSLHIKPIYISTAETFIRSASLNPSARQVQRVRESVLKAQRQVFKEMLEDDWPVFKNGDLFFKAQDDLAREYGSVRNPEGTIHSRVASATGTSTPSSPSAGFFRSHSTSRNFENSNSQSVSGLPDETASFDSEVTTPSGTFGEHPKGLTNSDHADLFGGESLSLTGPGENFLPSTSALASTSKPLFEDDGASRISSGLVSPRVDSINDNFHFLVGNTKGSRKGFGGRAPLFDTDPLFEDVEEEEGTGLSDADASALRSRTESDNVKVEIEMMDAVTSILDDDESRRSMGKAEHKKAPRNGQRSSAIATKTGKSTAARDLRPAFRRFGTRDDINREEDKGSYSAKGIFEEDFSDVQRTPEDLDLSLDPSHASVSRSDSRLRHRRGSDSSSGDELTRSVETDCKEPLTALGELDLASEISRVGTKLSKLFPQEEILAALMRKAELTGAKDKELRLLMKSKTAIGREIRELTWQLETLKKQYEGQKLRSGKTFVRINNSTIGHDLDGKEFAMYLIEVSQFSKVPSVDAPTSAPSSGWIVGRRYSEFFALHQRLKERFPEVRSLEHEFPGRRFVGLVNAPFIDSRRTSLDRYLQQLAQIPRVIESVELSLFLSKNHATSSLSGEVMDVGILHEPIPSTPTSATQAHSTPEAVYPGQSLVKTLFKGMSGVAGGLDGLIFGQSMFEVVHQRLVAQSYSNSLPSDPNLSSEPLASANVSQAMEGASLAEVREAAAAGTTLFTEPIIDLVSEIFELKREKNWLRRQALVIIIQQLLGGTIERKLRDTFSQALSPSPLLSYIASLQNGLWPNGQLKEASKPRTLKEKAELRESANKKLSTFIPDIASSFIGRQNARRGARKMFSVLQNRRLNRHLIYTILDQVFDELFPFDPEDTHA